MYLVSAWSFQNGFLDYVNRSELNKLEALGKALQNEYSQHKSWDFLTKDRRSWHKFLESYLLNPVEFSESTLMRNPFRVPEQKKRKKRERVILLDQEKAPILGARHIANQAVYKPIMHNNRIVGYLGIEKKLELSDQLDQVFSQQQQFNLILIAIGSILIAVVIALPFSSRLIKPIAALLQATLSLTKGDYSQRVSNHSKDEIGQLSNAFNHMSENLEKQEGMQKQWLADISHELRTPLSVAKAEIEAMLDGVRPINKKNIESLQQELNHLNALVEDLHELSVYELEIIKPNKKLFSFDELIDDLLENFKPEFEEKNLTIIFKHTGVNLFADQTKLTQVFINLIQNNLRYTEHSGTITISACKAASQIIINWEDSGPGVPESNQKKLFDRLYREDSSRSLSSKGSGLGLSICKSIIQSHQGSIRAYTSPLNGLGIEIKLPGE